MNRTELTKLLSKFKDNNSIAFAFIELERETFIQIRVPIKYIQVFAANFPMIQDIYFNPERNKNMFRIIIGNDKLEKFGKRLLKVIEFLKERGK